MTDTPRTEEALKATFDQLGWLGPEHEKLTVLARQLERENIRLREALEFYAKEWITNGEGDPTEPGLWRSWQEPSDALWSDVGERARAALRGDKE